MTMYKSRCIVAAIVLMTVAYFGLVFLPGQNMLRTLRRQIQQDRQYLASVAALPGEVAHLHEAIQKAKTYCSSWQNAAPRDDGMGGFLAKFTSAAADSQVLLLEIIPQPAKDGKFLRALPVAIRCVGPFARIGQLLAQLETFTEPLSVEQLTLEPDASNERKILCTLTVTIFRELNGNTD